MRKCILTNEMQPKKDMIRVVINKEGEIFADATGKKPGEVPMFLKWFQLLNRHSKRRFRKVLQCEQRTT